MRLSKPSISHYLFLFFFITSNCNSESAQEMATIAKDLCIPADAGISRETSVSGNLEAKARVKFLGFGGGEGSASESTKEGIPKVPEKDLYLDNADARSCSQNIMKMLTNKQLTEESITKPLDKQKSVSSNESPQTIDNPSNNTPPKKKHKPTQTDQEQNNKSSKVSVQAIGENSKAAYFENNYGNVSF